MLVVMSDASARKTPVDPPLRIGISACLLGREVRFDGQHKRDDFLCDVLGPYVEWVPVCPEVELGLGIPRETMRLVAGSDGPELLLPRSGRLLTREMNAFAAERVEQLANEDLCGYVLKKDSPSCGWLRVKVYPAAGVAPGTPPARSGRGLFAEALQRRFPLLPIEEEGRLNDLPLRENFVERVFAYRQVQGLFAEGWTLGELVEFHTAHKLTLLAHSPGHYRELGRLVATASGCERGELRERYRAGFLGALQRLATVGRQVNVLQHIAGYFRKRLDDADRRELEALIEEYRLHVVPLMVPLTLVRHHARRLEIEYLLGQAYLRPHPKERMLRDPA